METVFPRFCVECRKEGRYICDECLLFLSESDFVCPVCQRSSRFGKRHKKCRKLNRLDGLISFWDYDGVIKKAVHLIKFDGFFHVMEEIMEHFLLLIQEDKERISFFLDFLNDNETCITFVPLNESKQKEKGFNESKILAQHIAKATGKKVIELIEKTRNTEPQLNLEKQERFLNVKDAFSFKNQKDFKVEKVLIVDDIWMSGSTMKECCRVLKENGVKKVWGLVVVKA